MYNASAATPVARATIDDEEPVKRPTARELEALVISSLRIAFQQVM
jgi:hypothetical protein